MAALSEYEFYKENDDDKVWWADDGNKGPLLVSFDKKTVLNLFTDYPWKFTPEQKALFDKENPYWANFFADRKQVTS